MSGVERPIVLLVNPSSGGGRARQILPAVEARLRSRGARFRVIITQNADHAISQAGLAADAGELPVVVSGDGLVGMIGGALAGGGVPMGIIPGGRGNDLARVLGIPAQPEKAADLLLSGYSRAIDVGEANGRRFLCIASAGFDSDANRIANETRLIKGRAVYAYAALRALLGWKPARFEIETDSETIEFTGFTVAVANSRAYGGGMFVAPNAILDDGRFDIVTVSAVSKLRFLANLPKVFKGSHVDNAEVDVYRSAKVELRADRPFRLYADGEYLTDLPAKLKVLPGALRLIAPPARKTEE